MKLAVKFLITVIPKEFYLFLVFTIISRIILLLGKAESIFEKQVNSSQITLAFGFRRNGA